MNHTPPSRQPMPERDRPRIRGNRILFLTIGWICVGLGAAGIVLPILPGTPFLIVALWAFSRSSKRFRDWLLGHRFLGPPVRRWQEGRVVPARVKAVALTAMSASFAYLAFFAHAPWYVLSGILGVMAIGAAYILKCPSRPRPVPPGAEPEESPAD